MISTILVFVKRRQRTRTDPGADALTIYGNPTQSIAHELKKVRDSFHFHLISIYSLALAVGAALLWARSLRARCPRNPSGALGGDYRRILQPPQAEKSTSSSSCHQTTALRVLTNRKKPPRNDEVQRSVRPGGRAVHCSYEQEAKRRAGMICTYVWNQECCRQRQDEFLLLPAGCRWQPRGKKLGGAVRRRHFRLAVCYGRNV